jgi:hypothetical protein
MGGSACRVTVSIGVTVWEPAFTTYAVRPFGVTTIPIGRRPTLTGLPARRFARLTGVTVPDLELTTHAIGRAVDERAEVAVW